MRNAANGRRPLKQAAVPLVPMETCRRRDWLGLEFTLTERMMCAGYEHGGTDTCQVFLLLLRDAVSSVSCTMDDI